MNIFVSKKDAIKIVRFSSSYPTIPLLETKKFTMHCVLRHFAIIFLMIFILVSHLISWENFFLLLKKSYLQNIFFFIQRREVKRISLQKNEDYGVKIRSFLTNE